MNKIKDTIFALSTIEGRSGVAVIRTSGNDAKSIFSYFGIAKIPKPRVAFLSSIKHPSTKEILDKGLVLWFPAPNSFTGEDVVEFHLHGSRAVIRETIFLLGKIPGFRHAEPGEFSLRAFENQKMGLTELEGLADLIDAQTQIQQRQAVRQMSGELLNLYEDWRHRILQLLAHVEAYIDFPDEDLPKELSDNFLSQAEDLVSTLSAHLADKRGEIIREGFYAVILGAPNVGKSSLLNYLAKRDVAIVSDIAGTTRDIIEVHLDLGGYPLTITDTAGIRESHESIEQEGIRRALERAKNADLKIIMFDATSENPDKESLKLIDENSIVVINKSELANSPLPIANSPLPISIKTGAGLKELLTTLENTLRERLTPSSSPVFTRERHRISLEEARTHLNNFTNALAKNSPIELCAENLRLAARALGKITGKIDVEEILGKIFSSFCIGK